MRRLLLLSALLFSSPLAALTWDEVKAALQAKYPSYDVCLGLAVHALLSDIRILPGVRQGLEAATTEIITLLPDYIQGTINAWPKGEWPEQKKWRCIAEMHHAKCILAGAVQLQIGLAVLKGAAMPTVPRLLMGHPGFGPRPEDSKLRETFGKNMYEVQFAHARKEQVKANEKANLMLECISQCSQVLLGYSSPASS